MGESEELSFTDNELINAPWDNYSYGVSVLNGIMEGDIATNNKVAGGKVTEWPFSPDLTDDKFIELSKVGLSLKITDWHSRIGANKELWNISLICLHSILLLPTLTIPSILKFHGTDINYEELLEIYLCVIERDTSRFQR